MYNISVVVYECTSSWTLHSLRGRGGMGGRRFFGDAVGVVGGIVCNPGRDIKILHDGKFVGFYTVLAVPVSSTTAGSESQMYLLLL